MTRSGRSEPGTARGGPTRTRRARPPMERAPSHAYAVEAPVDGTNQTSVIEYFGFGSKRASTGIPM